MPKLKYNFDKSIWKVYIFPFLAGYSVLVIGFILCLAVILIANLR